MAQRFVFVRHAKAEDSHPLGDKARGLTAKGRASFRAQAQDLAELVELRGVATSPLVRAVQTAEILASALHLSHVVVRRELASTANHLLSLVDELGPGWAFVGHQPSLGDAAALALGLDVLPFAFKKGAAISVVQTRQSFEYEWFACPGKPLRRALSD